MVAKLTRLTHTIVIHLNQVAESCTICSSCSRWPVQKLLDTPSSTRILQQCHHDHITVVPVYNTYCYCFCYLCIFHHNDIIII